MNLDGSPVATSAERWGLVNLLGVWTLYVKEVMRFVKVLPQTVFAPVATTLLFMIVFKTALASGRSTGSALPIAVFLAPGLIMMQVIQNAFMNVSSSILVAKVQGNIVDFLMPPLSAGELTFAFVMGGVTRGLVVALGTALALMLLPFPTVTLAHPWAALFHVTAAAMLLSSLGVIGGVWAEKFDHMAVIINFVIMPLSFLSGTFYSVERLTGIWHSVSLWNPFFYLIDGLRSAMTGLPATEPERGLLLILGCNGVLALVAYGLLASGYRLKN